jgi:hypothetical protein
MGPQVMYLNLPPWQYIQNQTVLQKVDAFLGLVSRIPEKKKSKNFEYLWLCGSNAAFNLMPEQYHTQDPA